MTNTEARFTGMQMSKVGTTRTVWHPYGREEPRVDVTGDDAAAMVGALVRLGFLDPEKRLSARQLDDLDLALSRRRDVNWPEFGCIRYQLMQLHRQPRTAEEAELDMMRWMDVETNGPDVVADIGRVEILASHPMARIFRNDCNACGVNKAFSHACARPDCPHPSNPSTE